MKSSRVTVIGFLDRPIEGGKLGKNRNDSWCFVLHLLLLNETAISPDTVDDGNFRSIGELIVKPPWHTILVVIGAQLIFLMTISML
jgi:hypothetical protein